MVRPCVICGVKKNREAAAKGIRFFRFPSAKSVAHTEWVEAIRNFRNGPFTPHKSSIVCSQHFEAHCFNRAEKRLRLIERARPTIFDVPTETETLRAGSVSSNNDGPQQGSSRASSIGFEDDDDEEEEPEPSDSLSPPDLLPLRHEANSDFEETVEEPPDLDLYSLENEDYEHSDLTNLSKMGMIKMDHIGSVADILGPDSYFPEGGAVPHTEERSESVLTGEERDEVDGQTILSFTTAEEMEEYISRQKALRQELEKKKETKKKESKGRHQDTTPRGTPTPSVSPSPSLLQSVMGMGVSHEDQDLEEDGEHVIPNQSETPSPTSTSASPSPLSPSPPPSRRQAAAAKTEYKDDHFSDASIKTSTKAVLFNQEQPSITTACTTPLPSPPPLGRNGIISAELAEYAAQAFQQPLGQRLRTTQPSNRGMIKRRKPKSALWSRQQPVSQAQPSQLRPKSDSIRVSQTLSKLATLIQADEVPSVEINEVLDVDMADAALANEEVVVNEEEYNDNYDVPGSEDFPKANCGQLFCRLGCICSSLEASESKNRTRKGSQEHCNVPECMMQCVCGFQRGRPSRRRPFISLLKGNEAFYRTINWSGERQRRERKVPERYAEYHLSGVEPPSFIPEVEYKAPASTRGGSSGGHRGGHNSLRSPPSSRGGLSNKRGAGADHSKNNMFQPQKSPPNQRANTGPEPFRLKIAADQIKLLRWNSFVCLNKVYVAPDQEIMCMDHNKYNCPCIVTNRRIIRIAARYIPPPPPITIRSYQQSEAGSAATPTKVNSFATTSPLTQDGQRNQTARKHTNPNMRFANQSRVNKVVSPPLPDENSHPSAADNLTPQPRQQVPLNAMSKMRKLLSDERFQLQKLMTQEKARAFDEDIDLTVRQGQTVQLVAWIRFHRIYQSGQIHIRFLSRRAGPVILVMRPSEVVAADITCDIQDMRGKDHVPEIVKELLDPFIAPTETSRYAFLLCDGAKWELVGCLAHRSPSDAPAKPRETITIAPPNKASNGEALASDQSDHFQPSLAESNVLRSPEITERFNKMEQKRIQLEQRLVQINSKLIPSRGVPPLKLGGFKPAKVSNRNRSTTVATSQQNLQPPPLALPLSGRSSTDSSSGASVQELSILPDDSSGCPQEEQQSNGLYRVRSLPDLVGPRYPAAETLAILSKLSRDDDRGTAAGSAPLKSKTDKPLPELAKMSIPFQAPGTEEHVKIGDHQKAITKRLGPPPDLAKMVPGPSTKFPLNGSQTKFIRLQAPLPGSGAFALLRDQTAKSSLSASIRPPTMLKLHPLPANQLPVIPPGSRVIHFRNPSAVSPLQPVPELPIPIVNELSGTRVEGENQTQNEKSEGVKKTSPVKDSTSIAVSSILGYGPSSNLTPEWSPTNDMHGNSDSPIADIAPNKGGQLTESPAEVYIYPKISSAEVNVVKTPNGATASTTEPPFRKRMRVAFEALTGDHRMLCPAPTSMLLPLHRCDDRWLIVAVSHVPENGLRIPGLSVSVPRSVVERAAVTAGERKARVSFPLHLHNSNSKSPILKKGFGVYGTPQLPCHVFLGPFPSGYLDGYVPLLPCMRQIELTTTPPLEEDESAELQSVLAKPKHVAALTPTTPVDENNMTVQFTAESMMQSPTEPHQPSLPVSPTVADATRFPVTADAEAPGPSSFETETPMEAEIPNETEDMVPKEVAESTPADDAVAPTETEDNGRGRKRKNSASSSDLEIVGEVKSKPGEAVQSTMTLPAVPPGFTTINRSTKPLRVFIARTQGLPSTTIAIYDGDIVLVKHPLKPEKSVTFTDVESAKRWLQTLTILNRSGEFNKDPRTGESPNAHDGGDDDMQENSQDYFYEEDEEQEQGGDEDYFEDYYGVKQEPEEQIEEDEDEAYQPPRVVDSAESSPGRSPAKRARKLTEKAKILAAQSRTKSWTSAAAGADRCHSPPSSPRPSIIYQPGSSPQSTASMLVQMDAISQSKRNSIQRQLHIKKEQERRGLLGMLLRNLDAVIAPNSGTRAKIVVLKNATSTIKTLEHESLILEDTYAKLKRRRRELLAQRQKIFAGLKGNVRNVFDSLMDSAPLPVRHVGLSDHARMPGRESHDGSMNDYLSRDIIDSLPVVDYYSSRMENRYTHMMSATNSDEDSDVDVTTADVEIASFPI